MNTDSIETAEVKPIFEPAKEGDVLPEGIWIPNRKERRLIKKNKEKNTKKIIGSFKDFLYSEYFFQDLYKDLYENLKKKRIELEKEEENNATAN